MAGRKTDAKTTAKAAPRRKAGARKVVAPARLSEQEAGSWPPKRPMLKGYAPRRCPSHAGRGSSAAR